MMANAAGNSSLITQDNLKNALGSFKTRSPISSPLTELTLIKLRLLRSVPAQDKSPLDVLRVVLLEAMSQLSTETSRPPKPSLIRRQYVLGKEVKEILAEEHLSESTYFRRQRLELSELAGILMQMEDEAKRQFALAPVTVLPFVNDLPPYFVGRDSHLARAKEILRKGEHARVVFTGFPGAGKSTLAACLAQDIEVQQLFPDGVLWANVGHEGDLASCLSAWGSALGISPDASLANKTRGELARRRMLLVLDDVWSLEDASALMLGGQACGCILTTNSRVLAHLFAPDGVVEVGELDEDSARDLLHKHLPAEVLIKVAVDPTILDRVSVTERFGDLPLEVIRAARDMRSLAASGQTQRLLDYLTGAGDALAPRHFQRIGRDLAMSPDAPEPNMKQRILRSLSLLPSEAVKALKALTVFDPKPNSFREHDALAVAACDRRTFYELVDAGLIEPWHGRYAIHRSLWQVARLDASLTAARRQMALYFATALNSDDTLSFSAADARNIKRALESARSSELADAFAQIANGAFLIFDHPSEYAFIEDALLQNKGVAGVEALSAPVLARLARLCAARGESHGAQTLCDLAIQKAKSSGDADAMVLAMQTLADIEMDAGLAFHTERAQQAMNARSRVRDEQTMMRMGSEIVKSRLLKGQLTQVRNFLLNTAPDELEESSSAAANLALAYTAKGWFEWLHGDVPQAQARLTRMLARARERHFRMPYLFAVGALAWLMLHRGEYERAVSLSNELLAAGDRDVVPDFVACAFNVLGQVAADRGEIEAALQWLDRGIGYASVHCIQSMLAGLHVTQSRVLLAGGALPRAQAAATTALNVARASDSRPMACCASVMLGVIACERNEGDQSAECFNAATSYVKTQGANDPWTQLFYLRRYAAFLMASRQSAPAITQLNEVLSLARRLCALDDQAESLFLLAQAQLALGDPVQARMLAYESLDLHRLLGHRSFVRTGNWLTHNHLESEHR